MVGCGAFFASASSDETVKVWDCRRLEKDVSFRSRLTYTAQPGRVTALAACADSQTVASGSAAGSIHVWRVEYAARAGGAPERYTGIVSTRQVSTAVCRLNHVLLTSLSCPAVHTADCVPLAPQLQLNTPGSPLPPAPPATLQVTPDSGSSVLDLASWGPSLLVYSTQQGGLAAWDLRTGQDAWALPSSPVQGVVERFVCDPASQNWLVGGTSRGHLSLWDIRFRLPLNTWQHPAGAPISALALASAPAQRLGLGGSPAAPLLYVAAAGEQEVGVWDIAEAKCQQASGEVGAGMGLAAVPL